MRYYILVFLVAPLLLMGQQTDSTSVKKGRLALVASGAISVLGGSYIYVQKSWWSDAATDFHFDDGTDFRYALNVDKGGHFFGGILVADLFQGSLQWAGLKEKQAYLYGGVMGSFVQLGIEMKDAYAPYWGFSVWDFGAGTIGAFVPYAERYWEPMKYIDFKISYYKRSNHYWDLGIEQKPYAPPHPHAYQDDYINQTYWLSFFPFRERNMPLGISFGFGLDDTQYLDATNTKRGGNNEFYVALDLDWHQILKKWDTPAGKKVKHWLNYIKLPAPTIRFSPTTEFHPFFM